MAAVWIAPRPGGPRAARFFTPGITLSTKNSTPMEVTGRSLAETACLSSEARAGARAYIPICAEWIVRAIADSSVPAEDKGAAALAASGRTLFEITTRHQRNVLIFNEAPNTLRVDKIFATAESLTAQQRDFALKSEGLASERRRSIIEFEAPGSIGAFKGILPLSSAVELRVASTAALEAISRSATLFLSDLLVSVEWSRLSSSTGQALIDMGNAVRWQNQVIVDLLKATVSADQVLLQISAFSAAGAKLPAESIGQATTIVDAILFAETGGELRVVSSRPYEITTLAAGGNLAVIEEVITPLIHIGDGRLLRSPGRVRLLRR